LAVRNKKNDGASLDQAASARCRRNRVARRSGAGSADAQAAGFIRTALGSFDSMANEVERYYRDCARRSSSQRETRAKVALTKLRLRQRRDLLARFLSQADYIDVELRSARTLRALLAIAKAKNVRQIISFHDFKSTPSARILAAKACQARSHGADIFKVCYAHRHADGTRTLSSS